MKTPIQEFYEFMEQNQYFIGNDLLAKYKELIDKETAVIRDAYLSGFNDGEGGFVCNWDYYYETFTDD